MRALSAERLGGLGPSCSAMAQTVRHCNSMHSQTLSCSMEGPGDWAQLQGAYHEEGSQPGAQVIPAFIKSAWTHQSRCCLMYSNPRFLFAAD